MWKTLIVLGILGYAGWLGYQKYLKPVGSEAFQEFERFSDLMLANKTTDAENMTDGGPCRALVAPTARALLEVMPISHASDWSEVVETPSANGKQIDFTAIQTVKFDPAGTTSTFGTMQMRIKWDGSIKKDGEYWRIVAFNQVPEAPQKVQ